MDETEQLSRIIGEIYDASLDPDRWELVLADERPRPMASTGVDAVIRARRRS